MLRRLLCLSLLFGAFGCGEEEKEEPPPNKPEITGATAACRTVSLGSGEAFLLQEIVFTVQDLDGVEDLGDPVVVAEATRLTDLEIEDLPWADTEVECATASCQRRYTWTRTPTSEQIHCGDDAPNLEVAFEIKDQEGFPDSARVNAGEL